MNLLLTDTRQVVVHWHVQSSLNTSLHTRQTGQSGSPQRENQSECTSYKLETGR